MNKLVELFDREDRLVDAAFEFAESGTTKNRKRLRQAALDFALLALQLDPTRAGSKEQKK